jgi:adenosine kinase
MKIMLDESEKMSSQILLIGKIGYQLSFNVSTNFRSLKEFRGPNNLVSSGENHRELGGKVTNIAYGLSVLNNRPSLISIIGNDLDCYYKDYLRDIGDVENIFYDSEKETACDYVLTDENDHTIVLQQNNCYNFFAERSLDELPSLGKLEKYGAVFVGTGKVEADIKFLSYLHQVNKALPIVFSPDKNVLDLLKWRVPQILDKIVTLVCKESELQIIEEKVNENRLSFFEKYPRLKYIIIFEPSDRIIVLSKRMKMKVSHFNIPMELSNDDWEDAFRAGILYGIANKQPIETVMKVACSLASYCLESPGKNSYSPSVEQVQLRAFEINLAKKENEV